MLRVRSNRKAAWVSPTSCPAVAVQGRLRKIASTLTRLFALPKARGSSCKRERPCRRFSLCSCSRKRTRLDPPRDPDLMSSPLRSALTIAGSDSSGGAGIQADLKTFAALGVYGTSAITAITAQNTAGIEAVAPLSADLVTAQIEAVAGDIEIHATKIGMLATTAIVEAVAAAIEELDLPLVVLDPVLVSKSGVRLLDDDGVQGMCVELLPRAFVVTPNLPEAEVLSGKRIVSPDDARDA